MSRLHPSALVLTVSLFVGLLVQSGPSAHAATFIRGDSSSDGHVTMWDPVFTLCYIVAGGPPPACLAAADWNNDNAINVSDSALTLAWLFTGGPPSPPPGPFACGLVNNPPLGCNTQPPCVPSTPAGPAGLEFRFMPLPPLQGPTNAWRCGEVTAQILNNTANPTPLNIQGWSLSIVKQGSLRILDVTTAGTAVPNSVAFQKSEVTDCGRGATSAVLVHSGQGTSLPPSITPYNVLRIKVMRPVNNAPASLQYQNNQACSGQPVKNIAVVQCGLSYTPQLMTIPVAAVPGPGPNTPVGTNVEVCLNPWVWVRFGQIATPMNTTALPLPVNLSNFTVIGMAFGWLLGPFGNYPPGVTVNIRYPCNWTPAQKLAAQLLHNNNLVPNTTNNTCTNVLTGLVAGFSEFAVVLPPEMVPFRRGDSSGDGPIDLSDVVHLLGCQFLGTACPTCPDAGDANDDGRLDIGDAIFVLSYQFLGTREPPAPGPTDPGLDPTEDGLGPCAYVDLSGLDEDAGDEE